MTDRHQAPYVPFRCSKKTSDLISQIAKEQHRPKSEVLRDLVDKGLTASGAKVEEGELYRMIQEAVNAAMKPQVERLAAISAKATHIAGAAFWYYKSVSVRHRRVFRICAYSFTMRE